MAGPGRGGFFGSQGGPELELGGVTSPMSLPAPSWKGRALGGLFFLIALVCAGVSFYNTAHVAGLAGQHGTITVERCWTDHGSGRNSSDRTVCSGTFRPDRGGPGVDREAVVHRELRPGDEAAVQHTGRGYLPSGAAEIWRWSSLFFIAWVVAALGVPFAVTGIFPSRTQAAAVGAQIRGTRSARVMKRLLLAGAAGTAVCLCLTWLL